jgi:hypothetical protein
MAEAGSWPSIRALGLLSTTALLDRLGVIGEAREAIESRRRPAAVPLAGSGARALIRDNGPLHEGRLAGLLDDGLGPRDWYRTLNARVFFWLRVERLLTLMRAYPDRAHDVLEVDAAALVEAHRDRITLSPINSGAIGRAGARRGLTTFSTIADYDYARWRRTRGPRDRVVELAVTYAVPDVARFVVRVTRMRQGQVEAVIWERGEYPPEAPGP